MDRDFLDQIEALARQFGLPEARAEARFGDALDPGALSQCWARLELVHPTLARPIRADLGSQSARTAVVDAARAISGPISCSWSHHGTTAIALASPGFVGLGIDLEPVERSLSVRLQAKLRASSGWEEVGIREWAMLEAAVKAAPGPRLMSDFRAHGSQSLQDREGCRFRVGSVACAGWVVGLAVREA